jgi:single-strand DNA-binding protein
MPNYASVTLIGHLGRDPENRTTNSGDSVTSFSLATNKRRKDGDLSTWWNCTCWGKRGETLASYLKKGDPVLIQGEPSLRPYTTKDGRDGLALEVEVREWTFVGTRADAGPNSAPRPTDPQAPAGQHPRAAAPAFNDDIPF